MKKTFTVAVGITCNLFQLPLQLMLLVVTDREYVDYSVPTINIPKVFQDFKMVYRHIVFLEEHDPSLKI